MDKTICQKASSSRNKACICNERQYESTALEIETLVLVVVINILLCIIILVPFLRDTMIIIVIILLSS